MSSKLLPAVLIVVVVALSLFAGCPKQPAPPEAAGPGPGAGEGAGAAPPAGAAAPAEFTWSEAPKLTDIPAGPVQGSINGKPFTAATIRLKMGDQKTALQISDASVDTPTGVITGDTGAGLEFGLPPGKPGELVKGVKDAKNDDTEDAWYWYPQGEGKGPMTMNPDWGVALSITEWTSEKDPKDEDVLGKVKGKVAIVFADDKKSFVAGDFEGVYYK